MDSNNLENGAEATMPSNTTVQTSSGEIDVARIEKQLDQILVRLKHVDRRDRIRLWFGLLKILIPLGTLFLVYYISDGIIDSITDRFGNIIPFAIPGAEGLDYQLELPDGITKESLPAWMQNLIP